MDKRNAVLQWLNCLTTLDSVNNIADLANGNHFLEFAKTINKVNYESVENEAEEEALARRYSYIKRTINSHFHIDSGKLINFDLCKTGHSIHDLVLVILLLLSAMVNHSVSSVADQTRLTPLHHLELNVQEYIKECLEIILAAEEETKLFAILFNIASSTTLGTPKTRFSSSPQQSPTVTPILRKRTKRGKLSMMQSPLKVLMESPNFKQQVAMNEKKKEINNLRERLNSEENKAIEFESKNNELTTEIHNKEKEIRELKERVNFLNSFRVHADEYDFKKAQFEEKLAILEKKQKKCNDCKHQENCIKTLEDELFDLKVQNEIMETKCKNFQSQHETFEKGINERDSIIRGLTISKSEDDDKIQELSEQVTKLLSCEAIYKKKYEEDQAEIKIQQEPFQTPQRSEGETMKGVIDKMLQEMEAELEKEKTKVQEFEEKVEQSQTQQKIKDEENEKLHFAFLELQTKFDEIENSKLKLHEELDHATVQCNLSIHQVATLESAIDTLRLESSVKERKLEGDVSQLLERIEQQKLELRFSTEDYSKLLSEKEAAEKQLHHELEIRQTSIDNFKLKIMECEEKIVDSRENCEKMQQRIDTEKERVIQLQNEKAKAMTKLEVLAETYQKFQIETTATSKKLKDELQLQKESIEGYIIKVAERDVKIATLNENWEIMQQEKDANEEKIIHLEKEKTEVTAEVEFLKEAYQKLLLETDAAKKQCHEKLRLQEKSIDGFKIKIAECDGTILTLKDDFGKIQQEKEAENQTIIQLEKEKNEVINMLQVSKENYEQLLTEKKLLEKNWNEERHLQEKAIKNYELKIAGCDVQLLTLKKEQDSIQQELSVQKEKIMQLTTEKAEVATDFELFRVNHEKLLAEKNISEEQLNKELYLQKKFIEEYEVKISQHYGEILILQEEGESMQQERDAQKEAVIQLQKEKCQVVVELELLNQKYQELLRGKKSVERLLAEEARLQQMATEEYEAKISQLDGKIITLQVEHESVQQEVDIQKETIIQLQNGKNEVATELQFLNQNYKNLIAKKESVEKQLNEVVQHQKLAVEDYKTTMAELHGKISTLNDKQESVQKVRDLEKGTLIQLQKEKNEIVTELQFLNQIHQNLILEKERAERELNEKLRLQKLTIEDYEAKIVERDGKIVALKEEQVIVQQEKDVEGKNVIQLLIEKTKVIAESDLFKENYQKLLTEAEITEGQLNEELQLQKRTIEEYGTKIVELGAKIVMLNEEQESVQQERDVEKETAAQLQQEKDKMITELGFLNQNYQNLVIEKETGERLLNEELQLQKVSIKQCEAKITERDGELMTLKVEQENIQREKEIEKEAVLQLQKEKNEVVNEFELLNQNYQRLLMETEATKSLLNEEVRLQKITIEQYETQIAEQNKKLLTLKEEQENVQREKEIENEMVIQLQKEKNSMATDLELLNQSYHKLLTESNAIKKQLNEELQLYRTTNEDCRARLAACHGKIEILEQEQERLQQEKTAEKESVMQLENERNEVISEFDLLSQTYQKLLTEKETTEKQLNEKLQFQEKCINDYEYEMKIAKHGERIVTLMKEQKIIQQQRAEDKERIVQLLEEKTNINVELELLNDKYQKMLMQTEASEKQLYEELQFLKINIVDYKVKITERDEKIKKLQKVCEQSPNYIEKEYQSMLFPLENSENNARSDVKNTQMSATELKLPIQKLAAQFKAKAILLKNEAVALKGHDANRNALKVQLLRIREEMLNTQVDLIEKSPNKCKIEPSDARVAELGKEKNKSTKQKVNLQFTKNDELSNLQLEKTALLVKLDESLKTLKLSKEKSDNEIKKLHKQLDEYKKIAEAATSEVKMMAEKLRNISKKDDVEKQLNLVTAKYKKAKEFIDKQNKEKKDLGKKLDDAMEKLRFHEQNNGIEAIRISKEECRVLRKELEETKKSNEPLKQRIKELENASLIQEQTCKSFERELKLARNQLRKTAEKCDSQSLRLSISSSSPCSLKTPLIKKPKREAHFEKKHIYVRERVTRMIDDSFLMPVKLETNLNHSFTSSTSEGHSKSVLGAGNLFQCADEEDYLNHSSLENINYNVQPPSATKRLSELQRRNTLCPPHMRSSYAVEMQMQSPSKFSNEALREGKAVNRVSPKRKRSSSQEENQKSDKETKVVVEKKKKSRKAFPTVNPEKFPWLMANRTPSTVRKFMKSIKEGFPNSPKPKVDSFWPFKS